VTRKSPFGSFLLTCLTAVSLGAADALAPRPYLYLKVYRFDPERLADRALGYIPVDPTKPVPSARGLCYVRVLGELDRFTVDRLVGVLSQRGLRGVDLSGQDAFNDHDCASLAALGTLNYLALTDTQVTDTGLSALAGLRRLTVLRAARGFTNASAEMIGRFQDLETLDLSQTGLTDAGLAFLLHLPLHRLELSPSMTDAGLQSLGSLHKLRHLDLSQTQVTDAGVAALAAFPRLETLLASRRWTSAGLIKLADLPGLRRSLRRLDLSGTEINDHATGVLALFENLEELALTGTTITDLTIGRLARLPKLRALELSDTLMTGAGLAELRALPKLEVLSISMDEHLSVVDLRPLRGLRRLRLLIVNGYAIQGPRLNTLMTKLSALDSKLKGASGGGENTPDFIARLGSPVPDHGLHRLEIPAESPGGLPEDGFS